MTPLAVKLVWMVAWMPILAPAEMTMHESAHLIMPMLHGNDATLQLLPSRQQDGTFCIASADWGRHGAAMSRTGDAFTFAMPRLIQASGIVAIDRTIDKIDNPTLWGLMKGLQLALFVDSTYNSVSIFRSQPRQTDAWSLQHDLPSGSLNIMRIITGVVIAGEAVLVARGIVWD